MSLYCVSTTSTVTSLSGSVNDCEISSRLKGSLWWSARRSTLAAQAKATILSQAGQIYPVGRVSFTPALTLKRGRGTGREPRYSRDRRYL